MIVLYKTLSLSAQSKVARFLPHVNSDFVNSIVHIKHGSYIGRQGRCYHKFFKRFARRSNYVEYELIIVYFINIWMT